MASTATNLLKLLPMRLGCQGTPLMAGGGRLLADNCIIITRGLKQQQRQRARFHIQVKRVCDSAFLNACEISQLVFLSLFTWLVFVGV